MSSHVGRRPPGLYRYVSELRIQFICEYQLFLRQTIGSTPSAAQARGSKIHGLVGFEAFTESSDRRWLRIFVAILTLVAALFWILW
ncbi:MAG: hypothetical protein ACW99U_08215 [Candidatus Thorarchaeota archaeon]